MSEGTSPTVTDEILARSLVIVDGSGRERIRLAIAGDGDAELVVNSPNGRRFVALNGSDIATGLRVDDGHRSCDVGAYGLEVSVTNADRVAELEERLDNVDAILKGLRRIAGDQ